MNDPCAVRETATTDGQGGAGCPHAAGGGAGITSLSDPVALRCPYPAYARMRSHAPVSYLPHQDLWVVSRYEDCVFVLSHPELFSSRESMSHTNAFRCSQKALEILRRCRAYPRARTLVLADPPAHTRYRRLMMRAFPAQRMAQDLAPRIASLADERIDAFSPAGHCEFVGEFAVPLAMGVMADVLGVPAGDIGLIRAWSEQFVAVQAGTVDEAGLVAAAQSTLAFEDYFIALLEDRYARPRDDFIGRLVNLPSGETALQVREQLNLIMQVMVAGTENTINFLGTAAHLLATVPGLAGHLRGEPELIPSAVEEILRFETPTQGLFRVPTRDVEIGGVTVPHGARVMVNFGSANRDETHFDEEFSLARVPAVPHLAFGRGVHACPGQSLARREGAIAIDRLVRRLPDLRLDPAHPPVRRDPFAVRGMQELRLLFTSAAVQ